MSGPLLTREVVQVEVLEEEEEEEEEEKDAVDKVEEEVEEEGVMLKEKLLINCNLIDQKLG